MLNSTVKRTNTAYFLFACIILFGVSVAWVIHYAELYRNELLLSVRISGWITYQTQLEYLKLSSEMTYCIDPNTCDYANVLKRAEILYSRLDILVHSTESNSIPDIDTIRTNLSPIIVGMSKLFRLYAPNDDLTASTRISFISDLRQLIPDLGRLLQDVLRNAQLYNTDIERREAVLTLTNPVVPFAGLGISGLGLMILLAREARARGLALRRVHALLLDEERQRSELISLMNSLPLPIVVIAASAVVFWNTAAGNLLGGDRVRNLQAIFGLLQSGDEEEPSDMRVHLNVESGQIRAFRCLTTSAVWTEGTVTICVLQDTSIDRDAYLEWLSVGKMAVLGELSFAFAHEINQPLATIKAAVSNAKMLWARDGAENQVLAKIEKIDNQVDKISSIIVKLRRFSSESKNTREIFSLNDALSDAMDIVIHQYEIENIRIILESEGNSKLFIRGERTLLELSVVNVLINARDAFVAANIGMDGDGRFVRVAVIQGGQRATLEITDNAGGFHPDVLPKMFDFFVSTKGQSGGMGIGLAVTKRCIEDMGGRITARNLPEGGAQFIIDLPIETAGES